MLPSPEGFMPKGHTTNDWILKVPFALSNIIRAQRALSLSVQANFKESIATSSGSLSMGICGVFASSNPLALVPFYGFGLGMYYTMFLCCGTGAGYSSCLNI